MTKNKLGLHAFVWEAGWNREQCARAIASTAALGFDLIEASTMDPSAIDVGFTRRELDRSGIGLTFSFGLGADEDISSGDDDTTRRGEQKLELVLSIARDLGATHVCGILYSAFQKYGAPATSQGVARSVEVIRRVGEKAAASNIILGMEVVNRYETNMINTASQGVAFCRRVGLPNVKVHLDCYHMNIEEADMGAAIIETGADLGYFHTGDSNRGYLGAGSVDFGRVFRALARAGCEGPINFESLSWEGVGQPLEGILGIWRDLWDDGRDLAAHARQFTEAHLKAARETVARGHDPLP